MRADTVTRFVAQRRRGSLVHCLCFGVPAKRKRNGNHEVFHFLPGQLFAVVRWRRHSEDRQHRSLMIVEAGGDPKAGCNIPGIHPSPIVHAMVDQHGPAGQGGAVDQLLDLIQDIKSRGDHPEQFAAKYWRAVAYRILLCEKPLEAGAGDFLA